MAGLTLFGHDPLEALVYLVAIAGVLAVGAAVWRAKTAEAGKAAADAWESIARAHQEKLEQRDAEYRELAAQREKDISDLKVQHAAETAQLQAQVDELRRRVEELQARDQTAVLELIRAHEQTASERHVKTLDVLVEIRDTLKEGAAP